MSDNPQSNPTTPSATPTPNGRNFEAEITALQVERDAIKAKYDGVQGYAKQEKEQREKLLGDFTRVSQELEGVKVSETAFKTQLEQAQAKHQQELADRDAKLRGYEERDKLGALVRDTYKNLRDLWEKGLLDVGSRSGDDLTKYLAALDAHEGELQSNARRDFRAGAAPNAPTPAGNVTLTDMAERLMTMDSRSPEYRQLDDQYMTALRAAQNK